MAAALTWYLVGLLPPEYRCSTKISTGILEFKGMVFDQDNSYIQEFLIESRFNELQDFMQSRRVLQRLSTRLLHHDLQSERPFREPEPDELQKLTSAELQLASRAVRASPDSLLATPSRLQLQLAKAYRYDYRSLRKQLEINRVGESDLMEIAFRDKNPELAHFAVQVYLEEFIQLFLDDLSRDERASLEFHSRQVAAKKAELDAKIEEIDAYRKANRLVDLSTQLESLLGQIQDYENELERERQKLPALEATIRKLDQKIYAYNRLSGEAYANHLFGSEKYLQLKEDYNRLLNRYLEGGSSDKGLERRLRKVKAELDAAVLQVANASLGSERERLQSEQVRDWV
ncbi:MAG: hypothetical protein D6765_06095, partial [Bacteroidetes bacterium]